MSFAARTSLNRQSLETKKLHKKTSVIQKDIEGGPESLFYWSLINIKSSKQLPPLFQTLASVLLFYEAKLFKDIFSPKWNKLDL